MSRLRLFNEDDGGRVLLDGIDPCRDRRAALGLVGILFQNPEHQIIFPRVGEEIAFGLRQQGLCPASLLIQQGEE